MYLILLTAFFLQVTLLDFIRIAGTKPDLGALFVIFIAIFFGWSSGIEAGFVFGLLKDIYSVDIFGINTATLAITGLIAGLLSPKFLKESRAIQTLIVFVLTLFYFFIHYFISSAISNITYISLAEYIIHSFIPVSLYTACLAFLIFPFFVSRFGLEETAEYL